ncbi:hypothetical protein Pint_36479 [Pistacia integerrima]|uniref:Uncharacterized protein n=1 Tax=Pistacia integerrima TaxID=434235 RepID=A0ACC0Y1F5_9ROSI|nr:hypothetical protein Pint_36479 [Pistacia integerrima]
MDLTQLEREKGWKQYTAISLLENKLKELSVRLVCPKLKILLLGGENQWDKSKLLKVSDECFEEMKALEVVSLRYVDLSLKSLQFLTNLKTLKLFDCDLRDISFVAKLNKLEILSFRGSRFDELPIELSGLKELRMLDLRGCSELRRIPSNLIRSFSQLEELYMEMEDIFEEREVEEKSIETVNARLSELNYLPCLAVLYLKINSKCLPKDFAFSELSRYEICLTEGIDDFDSPESSKALTIADIDATLLTPLFKALYHSVEYLGLGGVTAGLIQLKNLEIGDAAELKQVFHGKEENEIAEEGKDIKLPSLKKLKLNKLEKLTRFFPENNHSTLPALEAPKIGCTEDESHQEQAPQIGSQEDSHQEQALERGSEDEIHVEQVSKIGSEDESHEETSTDLFCYQNFEELPWYIKNKELYSDSHPIE